MNAAEKVEVGAATRVKSLPRHSGLTSIDEINHRIDNSLQLLLAMISMESREIADPDALSVLEATALRITAIARVQRMLYHSHSDTTIELCAYLTGLCAELERSCGCQIDLRAEAAADAGLGIPAENATAVGVILSELVGNACKYAYPGGVAGNVTVALRLTPAEGYTLEVADRGVGTVAGLPPRGSGVGSRVIALMAERLGARFAWTDGAPGTRFELLVERC